MQPFSGVILTGGRSTRMGRDKAFVAVDGQPMVLRVATALRAAGAAEVLAIGGDTAALTARGLDARRDPRQGQGPLGGLLTAFEIVTQDLAVVLATDLAWIDAITLTSLVAAVEQHDVAVAHAGHREPLCAAWRVTTCSDVVRAAYDAGERAVHRSVATLDVVDVPAAAAAVANANTQADLVASLSTVAVPEISVDELASRLDAGAFLLDVRQPDEYVEAHVPTARLVPLDEVAARAGELPAGQEILVICRSGARSHRATEYLIGQVGLDAVNVAGGTLAWIESGRDIVVGSEPT